MLTSTWATVYPYHSMQNVVAPTVTFFTSGHKLLHLFFLGEVQTTVPVPIHISGNTYQMFQGPSKALSLIVIEGAPLFLSFKGKITQNSATFSNKILSLTQFFLYICIKCILISKWNWWTICFSSLCFSTFFQFSSNKYLSLNIPQTKTN